MRHLNSFPTNPATAADWEALEKGIVKVYGEVRGGK